MALQLNDEWEFPVDNQFPTSIVNDTAVPVSNGTSSNRRCAKCQQLEFWAPNFSIVDGWEELEDRLHTCDFCKMRWEVCRDFDREDFLLLKFDRDQSMLKLKGRYPPVLSIRRAPGESCSTKHSARGVC